MTIQNHTSNMYYDAFNKVMYTRNEVTINDKINLKTQSRIGMNGVLKFYSIGTFKINKRYTIIKDQTL